jgi:uncharacterized RDD family membrane protein YckC
MKCSQCGAEMSATDTFCSSCGTPVAASGPGAAPPPHTGGATPPAAAPPPGQAPPPPGQALPPPMPPPTGGYQTYRFQDPATGAPVAEWWQRAVALLIDGAIFFIPGWIIVNVLIASAIQSTTYVGGYAVGTSTNAALIVVLDLLFLVAYAAYYTILNGGEKGQTIGKMAMGIATRDESGQGPIGYGRALGRFGIILLFDILCFIPLLLDYLSPLWDPRRQAWHDKTARSLVITVR